MPTARPRREESAGPRIAPAGRKPLAAAPCSITTVMATPPTERLFRRNHHGTRRLGGGERLAEILGDVVHMLDADAQPDHLRPHAGLLLILRRHLPVRRRRRVAGERFRI